MLTVRAASMPRRPEWMIPMGLILLSLVPAVAGSVRLAELAGGARVTAANARFLARPLPVVLHIISVIPYSLLGAFQFAPGFRRRNRRWHRTVGMALVAFGLVAALTGLWMAQFYPWPAGDGVMLYALRLMFGSAMLMSIILAVDAIRRRDFATHGAWMTRGYAIGMGAGTQVLTHLPYFLLVGRPGEPVRALLMGAGWVINVAVAEWAIRRRPTPRNRASESSVPSATAHSAKAQPTTGAAELGGAT
jgi:uncharacterized membrane protein